MSGFQTASGLHVVMESSDQDRINRELRQLDGRLFCERTALIAGQPPVWAVQLDAGERAPDRIVTVLEWRLGGDGAPLPLSLGLVEEVKRLMQRGPLSLADILETNRRRDEQIDREHEQQVTELVADFARLGRRSPTVQRSRGLQLARQRGRRLGAW